jgi:KDO2-lipid IV(A) lauroyltransferase
MGKRLEYFLFLALRWFILSMPLKSAQRLGAGLGFAVYHLVPSRRNIALDNLRHAFPEKTEQERERIAVGAFKSYGTALFEFIWFPQLGEEGLRKLVRFRNPELLRESAGDAKGLILLSGHFGNWELTAFGGAALSGVPFTVVVQTQSNQYVDAVINRIRCLRGNRVVPMGIAVREIIMTLRRGGVIALAADQSGPKEGVYVNFFGRIVATHQGPAAFALKTGARVLMGFCIRQADGSYEIVIEEIPTGDIAADAPDALESFTQRHTALLERYIRDYPDHWQWMHRRWKYMAEGRA